MQIHTPAQCWPCQPPSASPPRDSWASCSAPRLLWLTVWMQCRHLDCCLNRRTLMWLVRHPSPQDPYPKSLTQQEWARCRSPVVGCCCLAQALNGGNLKHEVDLRRPAAADMYDKIMIRLHLNRTTTRCYATRQHDTLLTTVISFVDCSVSSQELCKGSLCGHEVLVRAHL